MALLEIVGHLVAVEALWQQPARIAEPEERLSVGKLEETVIRRHHQPAVVPWFRTAGEGCCRDCGSSDGRQKNSPEYLSFIIIYLCLNTYVVRFVALEYAKGLSGTVGMS